MKIVKFVIIGLLLMCIGIACSSCLIRKYTITFEVDGGSTVEPIKKRPGQRYTLPHDIEKTGYNFSGWYEDEDRTIQARSGKMPKGSFKLYAKWVKKQITISFLSDGGSAVERIKKEYGKPVEAPQEPIKDCYVFTGWYLNGEWYTFSTMPAESITLTAQWIMAQDAIKFESNGGGFVGSICKTPGEPVSAPAEPQRLGRTFDGWYTDNDTFLDEYTFSLMPSGYITLYAKWKVTGEEGSLLYFYNKNIEFLSSAFGINSLLSLTYRPYNFDTTFRETIGLEDFGSDIFESVLISASFTYPVAFECAASLDPENTLMLLRESSYGNYLADMRITLTLLPGTKIITTQILSIDCILSGQYKKSGDAYLSEDGQSLIRCLSKETTYAIPAGVTSIGSFAFIGSTCSTVTGTENVKEIGLCAFFMSGITVFNAGDGLEMIGYAAFYHCQISSFAVPGSVNYIGYLAFIACKNLSQIIFEDASSWYCVSEEGEEVMDFSNPSENAVILKSSSEIICYIKRGE